MTAILGISAFYHDSAAALLLDGDIAAAAQEERFTRKKHDPNFPAQAVNYCLTAAGITAAELDYVAFYEKPLLKFERLLETYLSYAPAGFQSFLKAMPVWLRQKLHLPRELRKGLGPGYRRRFLYPEHHESHAASAFFPSPFEEAAILTVDGVGEWATASFGAGRGNKISLTHELRFPHSLGMLYSAFTYFCGFKVNSGEYKLMGLAPFGEPVYADLIREKLLDIRPDGSFRMRMEYFNYAQGLTMTSRKFERLFGGPPRQPESDFTQREMNLAASIQQVAEELLMNMVSHVHRQTGMKRLCLAGGVALNCVANGKILREGPFEDLWIQPAAGDAGGALGAALLVWHQLLGNDRRVESGDAQRGSFLGPSFEEPEIQRFLEEQHAVWELAESEQALCEQVAKLLAEGKVVGWFQGRMEFGPRALGNRSILGDARSTEMQRELNLKIKFRESFRPFAPSVLQHHVEDYFVLPPNQPSPYMLLVADVQPNRLKSSEQSRMQGLDKLKAIRSEIPAVTHVDNSARIQTVDPIRHPRYSRLIQEFAQLTETPVIINTSFNVRGEPIVCTPADAWRCFLATNMDVLVLDRFILKKENQPNAPAHVIEAYFKQFPLD